MSSDYQQKKMMNALGAIDTKGNIVLEQFQDGTALLFQPGNAQPFCVATDYDRATASWSYGKYFSDLGCAHEMCIRDSGKTGLLLGHLNFRKRRPVLPSVDSSIPHSVRQASFSESSNDLRGGSTYATQNDEFADSGRASR